MSDIFKVNGVPSQTNMSMASPSDYVAPTSQTGLSTGQVAGMFIPALGALLTSSATISDIERKTDNVLQTMDLSVDQYFAQENIINQQSKEIDRTLGDAMSESGLKALKNQALLRAGAAETGTSGGTTDLVIKNAYMTQARDESILIGRAKQSRVDLQRRSDMNKQSLTARLAQLEASLETPTTAGLSVLSSAVSGAVSGYNMLTAQQRESFFNFDDEV